MPFRALILPLVLCTSIACSSSRGDGLPVTELDAGTPTSAFTGPGRAPDGSAAQLDAVPGAIAGKTPDAMVTYTRGVDATGLDGGTVPDTMEVQSPDTATTPDAMPDSTVLTMPPDAMVSTCENVDLKTGKAFPVGEGKACRLDRYTVGTCRAGACCAGCWDGRTCQTGKAETACGKFGAACEDLTGLWTCVKVTPVNAQVGGCRVAADESTCYKRVCSAVIAPVCCTQGVLPGSGKCRTL